MPNARDLRREIGPISPTALGSFVKLERCDQYLGWSYLAEDLLGDDERFEESILSPLYSESGTRFEADQLCALLNQELTEKVITPEDDAPEGVSPDQTWEEDAPSDEEGEPDTWESALDTLLNQIKHVIESEDPDPIVCFQPTLLGKAGSWSISGKADIIVVRPPRTGTDEPGAVIVDILEVKASSEEQTHHRIQAACYSKIIKNAIEADADIESSVAIEGRVVHRDNAIDRIGYRNIEPFDLEPTETDVELLLRSGGRVDSIVFDSGDGEFDPSNVTRVEPWEMFNRMSRRCAGCSFHDVCYTRAVEEDGLELLGFPEGTQEDLAEVGIETLGDLGSLVEYDEHMSPSDRTDDQVWVQDVPQFEQVRDEVGIKDLERYCIAADVFSTENSPNRPAERTYIPDSGFNLPKGRVEDSPLPDSLTFYADESLIRVYLFVQEDNIRDRLVLLGGHVTNHDTGERRWISAITDSLPGADPEEEWSYDELENAKDEVEANLLRRFLRGTDEKLGLVDAIQEVAPADLGDFGDNLDNPGFVHLYFYSPGQRDALTRATKRHFDEGEEFEALRTLLGLRGEIGERNIDQEMVSVLQEDFVSRHLLRFLGFGTVQTVEQFERPDPAKHDGPPTYRNWEDDRRFEWMHEFEGDLAPVHFVFREHFFDNAVDYDEDAREPLDVEAGLVQTDTGNNYADQFPFAHRHADAIPLEYIWASFDELTQDTIDPAAFEDEDKLARQRELVRRFRYLRGDPSSIRINQRHLRALAEKLAEAVEHIEASIIEWHKSAGTPKQPLPLDDLLSQRFNDSLLEITAREYLDLEHGSKERQLVRDWRQSIPYRIQEDQSILFTCTSPPEDNDETYTIEGEIAYTGGGDDTLTETSFSEGDWVVMTPVDDTQNPPVEIGINRATDIGRMPLVHITDITDGTISVAAPWNSDEWNWPMPKHDFMNGHHRYLPAGHPQLAAVDPSIEDRDYHYDPIEGGTDRELRFIDMEEGGGQNQVVVDEGATFVLDRALDNVTSYHCSRALNLSDDNHVLHWLDDLLSGDRDELETDFCNADLVAHDPEELDEGTEEIEDPESFVDRFFVDADSIDFEPNFHQRRVIRETNRHLAVVQGPPGTGKTSYTTTPAVLGRAFALAQEGRSFIGGISALSHDAVDEAFSKIAAVASDCQDDGCFDRMKIIRARPSDIPDNAVPYDERDDDQLVEHIAYHQDEGADRLRTLYQEYVLDPSEDADPTQFLICGPPTSIRGVVDKVARLLVDVDDQDHPEGVWNLLEEGEGDIFDFTVVDEASMMDLPQLFLVGAFLREEGQLLLAGDHRQMQPIQHHGWESETRETIEETIPFLSALDYIRFLKGDIEEMDYIERESPELDVGLTNDQQEDAVLPMYPLEETYRLPQPVADLLTELFYDDDGIQLTGRNDRDPIPTVDASHEVIEELIDPNEWVSVLVHSGSQDERLSELEATIAEEVLAGFDLVAPEDENLENDEISAGVVVPFTAQRDRLQGQLDDAVQAQTVEKFQGGERDLILLSMVASDAGYVNMLSDFLLSPYRFNVGASRMKRKLIIIASEAIFQTSDPDADQYDDQSAWKRLYQLTGALDEDIEPAAESDAQEIDPALSADTHCQVYHARLSDNGN